jgi:DNA-binding MarR family transcriptional regulator
MGGVEKTEISQDIASALLDCTCINLRVASRAMTRLYDEALSPSGIRITQLATLSALAFYGPFTVKALASALVMDRTTLTADLKPLASQGFLELEQGVDRRTRIVAITERGRAALDRAIPLWQAIQTKIQTELGISRLGRFLEDLREVVSITQSK